jgi:Transcriptional regulator/sugar kinase
MKNDHILAFDVGGTHIKAAVLRRGTIVESTLMQFDSCADASANELGAHFARIAVELLEEADDKALVLDGAGFAFPGPFDYKNGISLIRGLGKFEALYGLNAGELIRDAFWTNEKLQTVMAPGFGIAFENDAALFGLGELHGGMVSGEQRVVCLTIGTGLGSCFLQDGRLLPGGDGIPDHGWLYSLPYRDGAADDFISKRGVLQLADELGLPVAEGDVRKLALLASDANSEERRLFKLFGQRMADILADALRPFDPELVILGGQIAKSGEYFAPDFQQGLLEAGLSSRVVRSRDTQKSVFQGIYNLMQNLSVKEM